MTIHLDHLIVPARDKSASAKLFDRKVDPHYGNVYWNAPEGHQWEMLTASYARQARWLESYKR